MNNFHKFLENHLAKAESSKKKEKNNHAVLDKEPHFIFSVENPIYPEKQTKHMNHSEMVEKLNKLGYNAQGIKGKYDGEEENSILVHNPSKKQVDQLHKLAAAHGEESGLYSDGVNAELHFYHGDNAGFYHRGKGTVFFDSGSKPEDHYSHLGTEDRGGDHYFRHNLDFESFYEKGTHKPREQVEAEQQASEEAKKAAAKPAPAMKKAEEDDHLKDSLVHYSSQAGLKTIDPSFQGKGIDSKTKGRSLENKVSFFYRHGSEPESVVTQGAKSKYITKLNDDHKLYDMGTDPEGHIKKFAQSIKDHNEKNPQKQKHHNTDTMYEHLKEKGYNGIFNSTHDSLSNVVAMFGSMDVHSELPVGDNKVADASHKDVTMSDGKNRLDAIREMVKKKALSEEFDKEDETEELNFTHRRMFKAEDESSSSSIKINPEHGKKIANEYEKMKHDPSHPDVKKAYGALIDETKTQFNDIMKGGMKISKIKPGMENPYKNSKELHADIKANNHMWYYPTNQGFGSGDKAPSDHPMLQGSGIKHGDSELLANDLFRIVHDINGHHLSGESGFGAKGEHKAYNAHKKMYSPLAAKALATETLGQNSWVNFGPHGEHNRANPAQTKYADQKAGLLPDHIINGNWHSNETKKA